MEFNYFDNNEIIKSSVEDIKRFMASSVYRDFIIELDIRREETIGLLEDVGSTYTGRDYDKFRGRLTNLKEMKDLFINMHECKLNDIERDKEEIDNDS